MESISISTVREIASLLLESRELASNISLWFVLDDTLDFETMARKEDTLMLRDASSPALTKNGLATGMHAHRQEALVSAALSMI
jgi:hypothetical protein